MVFVRNKKLNICHCFVNFKQFEKSNSKGFVFLFTHSGNNNGNNLE